jgi:hypothetical protein
VSYLNLILRQEDDKRQLRQQGQGQKEQQQEYEFSSVFPFRIKQIGSESSSSSSSPLPSPRPDFTQFTNLLIATPFRFEPGNYKPGFAKPSMLLEKRIVGIPYYDVIEEQITEDVTNNEKPGDILPTTKITQIQKMRYIIDSNIYAKEDLILISRVESLDCAQQLLDEYMRTVGFDKKNYVSNYVYGHSPAIMQQLLICLYDYWPTIQSQVTSVRIGGKTITARYSGRGKYDVRLDDSADQQIRNKMNAGEQIENITVKPPAQAAGSGIKMKRIPKITISDIGTINCRANINYENFILIKRFIDETRSILADLLKGKQSPSSYSQLEEFDLSSSIDITAHTTLNGHSDLR